MSGKRRIDDLEANVHPKKRRRRTSASNEEEEEDTVGIIEKITLINFTCHSYLEVPLGRNVNFIIGRNGSGKSSIATAIVVALGGKASVTNRGTSLKDFIKKGCSYAQVSVQLRNQGADAFKEELYGKSVIVERRITSDGTATYKMKSAVGKVISNKKDELESMLDHFNIQVDSPLSILNQDMSRSLLQSSSPIDRYRFFLKATSLEQMQKDFVFSKEKIVLMTNTVQKKVEVINKMKEDVHKFEQRYKEVKQLREMKEKIDELKKQRVWAQVIEEEKKLPGAIEAIKNLRVRLPKHDEDIVECEDELARLGQEADVVEKQMNELTEQGTSLRTEQENISSQLKQLRDEVNKNQSNQRKVACELRYLNQERRELHERIVEVRASAETRDLESERRARVSSLEEKKEKLSDLQSEIAEQKDELFLLENSSRETSNEKEKIRGDVARLNGELQELRRTVASAQRSKNNKLRLFGDWMPRLLDLIKDAVRGNKFHRPPKGPIASHLTLKDAMWSKAVESSLKGLGSAFCCHDHHDQKVLGTLTRQVCTYFHPSIIVSPFQDRVHDVSRNKPTSQYPTVMDVLEIDDVVVANCLIDQLQIEKTLLIQSSVRIRNVIWSANPPAKQAYCEQGDQVIGGRTQKWISPPYKFLHFLSSNQDEHVRDLEQEIETKSEELARLHSLQSRVDTQLKEKSEAKGVLRRQINVKEATATTIIGEIREIENSEPLDLPADVSVLEEELSDYDRQVAECEAKVKETENEVKYSKTLYDQKKNEDLQSKMKVQELVAKSDAAKDQFRSLQVEIAKMQQKADRYKDRRTAVETEIEDAEKKHDQIFKSAEQFAERASQYCPRVDTDRSVKSLVTEIIAKEKEVEEGERNRGNVEQIVREYAGALDKYTQICQEKKNIQKYRKRLEEALDRRIKRILEYEKIICARATMFFNISLSHCNHNGRLKFDHNKQTLELIVNVNSSSRPGQGEQKRLKGKRDERALSGGERSFATVSFIASLWDTIDSPFRFLDEFDVFMDLLNRKIALKVIMDIAQEQTHRQFIITTPNGISITSKTDLVSFYQLQDP